MMEDNLLDQERSQLLALNRLVRERAERERATEENFRTLNAAAERELEEGRKQVVRYQKERAELEAARDKARRVSDERFTRDHSALQAEFAEARNRLIRSLDDEQHHAERELEEGRWTLAAVLEAARNQAIEEHKETLKRIAAAREQVETARQQAEAYLRTCRMSPEEVEEPAALADISDKPLQDLLDRAEKARGRLERIQKLVLPRLFRGGRPLGLFLVLWLLGVGPALWFLQEDWVRGVALGGVGAGIVAILVGVGLYLFGRARSSRIYHRLCVIRAEAEEARKKAEWLAGVRRDQKIGRAQETHDRELAAVEKTGTGRLGDIDKRRHFNLADLDSKYQQRIAAVERRHDDERDRIQADTAAALASLKEQYESDTRAVQERYHLQMETSRRLREEGWNTLASNWRQGLLEFMASASEALALANRVCPAWSDASWERWKPARSVPPAIRIGELQVHMARIPHGIPQDPRLQLSSKPSFAMPAVLAFPNHGSLLLEGGLPSRIPAVRTLQNTMMRLLTTLPPGKVRFTIIDPVGLGENFAAFMHLADYDEALVASRIWTEPNHIEHRLADLTAHMEVVIQKYLRNQYQTIEEYNRMAGEVAEPFRILVVANFPANFTFEAARRLVSIASSGARCGVYTLVNVDTSQPMPQGFNLPDLEQASVTLAWEEGRFVMKDPPFAPFDLTLDLPPGDEFSNQILHQVGEQARDSNRVEVPFEFIAPAAEQVWSQDSRTGVLVPLGQAGATKRQALALGKGTSQHVLIAGKTGSGKSTLLHALITNTALNYSPEEVELYLVDFKKGVEFKTYASHELPHARVVAIESEREFGLSVLQRLDSELKHRGDLFRDARAQDLNAYRQARPQARLPRILLIVDEFQEFFVEDDKIGQEAAQLLDRLVRQGRAFGLHVLLGSQTLGGAYSLARSTIDQMAVRIALQCSEADGHLILSDDNNAARLLSRPGEAIYNDANGLVEGNNPFQVVWLPDAKREAYLQQVRELARRRNFVPPFPQIVFEGNAPADVHKNEPLARLLEAPSWPAAVKAARVWLGDAIAIKEPTSAAFRPQSGSNLLVIGQQDEAALGMLATALVSLAGQHAPGRARFFILDGTPPDSEHADFLARLAKRLPQEVQVGAWRELAAYLGELAAELDRRLQSRETDAPAIYLFIHGLHRFRDLRRQEDDFGFSRGGEERAKPDQQFAQLLREGPSVDLHALVWCDTLANLNRAIERQVLREFEMRVLFQMSVADSSTLIDTPAASKLGIHRALFHSEEQGRMEKFRPYGVPADPWLERVARWLAAKKPVSPHPELTEVGKGGA